VNATDLPEGYAAARAGNALVVARESALGAVLREIAQHGSLHAWASSRPGARAMAGRGTAWAVDAPAGAGDARPGHAGRWVVRHYRRGGAVRWLRDRYLRLGPLRPLRELRASAAARALGVCTPEVVAVAVYPAGIYCRADLATAEVTGATDLAESLWAEHPAATDPSARLAALAAAGTLLRQLADAGVAHPDLNAKNILIAAGAGAGAPVAYVLDLDGCEVGEPLSGKRRREAQSRLERSLRKWERLTRRPLPPAEWQALRQALEAPPPDAGSSRG
jgi:3-deoxy-D-manno-octulosonic acid kinase